MSASSGLIGGRLRFLQVYDSLIAINVAIFSKFSYHKQITDVAAEITLKVNQGQAR